MIRSFACKDTEILFFNRKSKAFPSEILRTAYRKLLLLEIAENLQDLRIPPGNRLEKLTGDRAGQHSIRINDQWRICFKWENDGLEDVEIVDYH
jgi:toxin HigB-1